MQESLVRRLSEIFPLLEAHPYTRYRMCKFKVSGMQVKPFGWGTIQVVACNRGIKTLLMGGMHP